MQTHVLTDFLRVFEAGRVYVEAPVSHAPGYISGKICLTEISIFFLLLSIVFLEDLEPLSMIFLGGKYINLEPDFLEKKTVELKDYIFFTISSCQIAKKWHVVDAIELVVECDL